MMKDGKALQSATSHYFGNGFTKAFEIKFTNKNNNEENPWQTSWGISTRSIAAIIMTHGNDDGLVLPPDIAPIQVVFIPIDFAKHPEVLEKSQKVFDSLKSRFRSKIDISEQSVGSKFANYDMKGVPVRVEIGPRDLQNDSCVIVRRDTHDKISCKISDIEENISRTLEKMKIDLYESALSRQKAKTIIANSESEFENHKGFIKIPFCCSSSCENYLKEKYGFTSRCIPFDDELLDSNCPICGNKAKYNVYFAKAY